MATNNSGYEDLQTAGTTTHTILDGDPDTVYLQLVTDDTVVEADGALLDHEIKLVDADGNPVNLAVGETITVSLVYSSDTTEAADFTSRETSVTITGDGGSSYSFTNAVVADDLLAEGVESYTVSIDDITVDNTNFENLAIDPDNNAAVGTIQDDDQPLTAAADDILANENALVDGDPSSNAFVTQISVTGGAADVVNVVIDSETTLYGTWSVSATGEVTYTLTDPVSHDSPASGADENTAQDVDSVTVTVTDSAGNTDVLTVYANVVDDIPTTVTPDSGELINSAGNSTGDITLDISDGDIHDNIGADQPGGLEFNVDDGTPVQGTYQGDTAPSQLTAGGAPIYYYAVGDVLYGSTTDPSNWDSGNPDNVVFTITLTLDASGTNPDTYAFNLLQKIDPELTPFSVGPNSPVDFVGGNTNYVFFRPSDPSTADFPSVLVTPLAGSSLATTLDGTVNANADAGGANKPTIGSGEGLRVNFVDGITGTPTSGGSGYAGGFDHGFDAHVDTNGASAVFSSIKNNDPATAVFAAFNETTDPGLTPAGDTDTVKVNDELVTITRVVVFDAQGDQYVFTEDGTAGGFTVDFNDDGTVTVAGINEGDQVAVYTAEGYNAVEITHGGDGDFALGGYGGAQEGEEIQIVFDGVPVNVVDEDGDAVPAGNIDITLNPSASPIAVDLDGDGTEYLSRDEGVVFTDQSTGESVNTAWVAPEDGMLVIDANNSGTVDESREYVFTEWSANAETDLQAIAEVFDTNQDGVLDAQDEQFDQFAVWQDADSDGVTDEGELTSLTDLGVESIALTYADDSESGTAADGDVIIHGQSTVTFTDGSTTVAEDTSFAISAADVLSEDDSITLPAGETEEPEAGAVESDAGAAGGDSELDATMIEADLMINSNNDDKNGGYDQ